jgi:uncharacterized protein
MGNDILTIESFYKNGREGKLIGLECESKHVSVPPRKSCRVCGSHFLGKIELSGRGELISYTEVFVKSKEFPLNTPYLLGLVHLEEGGSLIGVVDTDSNSELRYGTKVRVEFRTLDEKELPRIFFRFI